MIFGIFVFYVFVSYVFSWNIKQNKNSFEAIRISFSWLHCISQIAFLMFFSADCFCSISILNITCSDSNYVNQWIGKVVKNVPLMLDESWRSKYVTDTSVMRGSQLISSGYYEANFNRQSCTLISWDRKWFLHTQNIWPQHHQNLNAQLFFFCFNENFLFSFSLSLKLLMKKLEIMKSINKFSWKV